jgi:hypothetical protein
MHILRLQRYVSRDLIASIAEPCGWSLQPSPPLLLGNQYFSTTSSLYEQARFLGSSRYQQWQSVVA